MPPLVMSLVFSRLGHAPMPRLLRPVARMIAKGVIRGFLQPQIKLHFNFIEQHLAHSGWFAGNDFSAADIQMSFPLEAAAARAIDLEHYPHIKDFLERIHRRPAYQEALKKGGPYAYA